MAKKLRVQGIADLTAKLTVNKSELTRLQKQLKPLIGGEETNFLAEQALGNIEILKKTGGLTKRHQEALAKLSAAEGDVTKVSAQHRKAIEEATARLQLVSKSYSELAQTLRRMGDFEEAADLAQKGFNKFAKAGSLLNASTNELVAQQKSAAAAEKKAAKAKLDNARAVDDQTAAIRQGAKETRRQTLQAQSQRTLGAKFGKGVTLANVTAAQLGTLATGEYSVVKRAAEARLKELEGRLATVSRLQRQYGKYDQSVLDKLSLQIREQIKLVESLNSRRVEGVSLLQKQNAILKQQSKLQTSGIAEARAVARARAEYVKQLRLSEDVLRKYGAKKIQDVDFSRVSKEDVGNLSKLANARLRLIEALQAEAKAKGAARATTERLNARYKEQIGILNHLNARYRELHHPLAQTTLLFRQFLRYAIGYGALYRVVGALGALVKSVVELDKQLFSLQAISASTDSQMKLLELTIKKVAVTTKFTTNEIAEAARVLAQAGVSAEEIPKTLAATADFAAATDSSLEIAADLLTTMRNVFKELDDNTIANQLTRAINISKLTAADLKTIFSLSGQIAKSYNLTSEQYLAAVTTLRNAGIKASTVSTGLRQALIELFSPDGKSVKILVQRYKALGEALNEEAVRKRFFEFTKSDNPLTAVIQELDRLGFTSEGQKAFQRAFDVRATNAISALIKNFRELQASTSSITFGEAAAEAAGVQMRSLSNSVDNLGAAFTVFGDTVLKGPVRSLEVFTDKATEMLNSLVRLDTELKKQGKSGLGTILQNTLTGSALGAIAGSRVSLGRTIGGGLAGLATGTAAGYQETKGNDTQALLLSLLPLLFGAKLGGGSVGKTLGSASSGLKTFGTTIGAAGGGLKGFANLAKATGLGGTIKIAGGALAALGTTVFGGPVAATLGVLAALFSVLYAISETDLTPFEQATVRLEAAQREYIDSQDKAARALAAATEFDIEKGGEGTTGKSLRDLQTNVQQVRDLVTELFGEVSNDTYEQVEKLLLQYRNAGSSTVRRELLKGIQQVVPSVVGTFEDLDQALFELGGEVENVEASVDIFRENFRDLFQKINDEFLAALITPPQTEDQIGAFKQNQALLQLVKDNQRFSDLLTGQLEGTYEQTFEVVKELAASISKVTKDISESARNAEINARLEVYKQQIERALSADQVGSDFALVVAGIIDSLDGISDETLRQLDLIYSSLENVRGNVNRSASARQAAAEAQQEIFRKKLQVLTQRDEQLQEERTNRAITLSQGFVDYANTPEFKEFIARQKKSADKSAIAARLEGLFEGTGETLAVGLDDLGREYKKNYDDVNREFLQAEADLLLSFIAERQQAGEFADFSNRLKLIDAAHAQDKAIARLKSEIDIKSKGKSKEGILALASDDPKTNPVLQMYTLLEEKQQAEVASARAALDSINQNIERQQGTFTPEQLQKEESRYARAADKLQDEQSKLQALRYEKEAEIERYKDEATKIELDGRKRLADLEQERIARALAKVSLDSYDDAAFQQLISDLNKLAEQRKQIYIDELRISGRSLKEAEKEAEARQDFNQSILARGNEFDIALQKLTESANRAAARLRAKQPTAGSPEADAARRRAGVTGNVTRANALANEEAALLLDRGGISQSAEKLRKQLEEDLASGKLNAKDDADIIGLRNDQLKEMEDRLYAIDTSLAEIGVRKKEVFGDSSTEIQQLLNLSLIRDGIQDLDSSMGNLAENIRDRLVQGFDEFGDALADVIIEGENAKEVFRSLIHSIFSDIARIQLKALLNQAFTGGSSGTGIFGSIFGGGGGGTAQAGASTGEQGAAASLQTAAGQLSGAAQQQQQGAGIFQGVVGFFSNLLSGTFLTTGTTLTTAATALTGAATALTAAAASMTAASASDTTSDIAKAAASSYASSGGGGARYGGIVQGYRRGGVIRGPGTTTSDSIAGLVRTKNGLRPVALSDKEGILTADAVQLLGEDFLHAANTGRVSVADLGQIRANSAQLGGQVIPAAGAGSGSPGPAPKLDLSVINSIDSVSVLKAAVANPAGRKALVNAMRADRGSFRSALIQ